MKYTHAIVRKPEKTFVNGITTSLLGKPDVNLAIKQHEAYSQALSDAGVEVHVLEADIDFPDGCFVEDTAIVTEKGAVITRPGDPTRRNEIDSIATTLSVFKKLQFIADPGTVDGGDILRIENHFYIGRSSRTNSAGASQLAHLLSTMGFTSSEVSVGDILHLKTGASYIGNETLICVEQFKSHFKNYTTITVEADEDYFANTVSVNDTLIVPGGFPNSLKKVQQHVDSHFLKQKVQPKEIKIVELNMSEFQKMDGGLTCLSLLW
jgi:dimethylargininase